MDNFLVNFTVSGVAHKREGEGFKVLNTFNDGFVAKVQCDEKDLKEKVDNILTEIKKSFEGEKDNDDEEKKERETRRIPYNPEE